jgi:hypothetical protein
MTDFGRYSISYQPGPLDPYSGVIEHSVEMSISGQANIEQMLAFFDAFLKANGYVYDGEVQIVEEESKSLYHTTVPGPFSFTPFDSYDFGDRVIFGGSGTDTISFGAAQSVEHGAKTWDDVISFG